MTAQRSIDYVIVGLGLAGACLALQLLERGKRVFVFDQPQNNRSTSVAAGLINPVTGKVLGKTFMADELFSYAFSFYRQYEKKLGRNFLQTMPIYRPFLSVEEQNEWMGRSTEHSLRRYIDTVFSKSVFEDDVADPFGGVLLKQSGYLDTNNFVAGVRELLTTLNSYAEEGFKDADVMHEGHYVLYHQLHAGKIIYCRGVADLQSQYFQWLPVRPLKGEMLLVRMKDVPRIYNRGVFVVPTETSGYYQAGATYDSNLIPEVTSKARAELEEKLAALIKFPYEVTAQVWGIRPTTPDRRPLLGAHPKYPNLIVFNGLGTKGVSQAPYFSGQLAAWLEGEGEIMSEVNIGRFKSLYSKFE